FTLFDLDKDNHIDYHEFKVALKALGFDLPKPEILSLLQTHGVPSPRGAQGQGQAQQQQQHHHHASGTNPNIPTPAPRLLLPYQQFQSILAAKILARDPTDEILRAFELFDEGQKGKITLADLRRVASELGEGLEEEELRAMIEEFDMDGDGAISRKEFMDICLG
ncbi:MAG: hypothetical protein Q9163_005311, partial [Psora crenata]